MRTMTCKIASVSLVAAPFALTVALSDARAAATTNGDATTGNNATISAPTSTIAAPTQNTGTTAPGNVNQAAKSAGNTNMITMATNGVMAGVWFAASFKAGVPCSDKMMCVFSGLSLAQMGLAAAAKEGSDATQAASAYNYDSGGGTGAGLNGGASYGDGGTPTLDATGAGAFGSTGSTSPFGPEQRQQLANIQSQLKAAGYSVGKDGTVTMPGGKQVSGASLGSADGMRAAGMSDAQIAEASAIAAKGIDQVKKQLKIMGLEEGGGGGGAGSGAGGGKMAAGGGAGSFGGLFGKDKKNTAARSAAGMTTQLSGDKIGASGDNIFQMVSRQYLRRDRENEFLK